MFTVVIPTIGRSTLNYAVDIMRSIQSSPRICRAWDIIEASIDGRPTLEYLIPGSIFGCHWLGQCCPGQPIDDGK
ncbi:MAG: hypothetical protein V4719_10870 [Planctomycetota bacterium]